MSSDSPKLPALEPLSPLFPPESLWSDQDSATSTQIAPSAEQSSQDITDKPDEKPIEPEPAPEPEKTYTLARLRCKYPPSSYYTSG